MTEQEPPKEYEQGPDWKPEPQEPPIQEEPQKQFPGERLGPPKQIDPENQTKLVHLPALISDNFGTSRSQARYELATGRIEIDGEEWKGDKLDVPAEALLDKELVVFGEMRQFKIVYSG